MTDQIELIFTVAFQDSDTDDVLLQEFTEILCQQIVEVDGVYQANLVEVDKAPDDSRAIGGFILGLITAKVNPVNIKTLVKFLSDRLTGKTIKMSIETKDGRKLTIEASSQSEFEFAIQQAEKFSKVV
jgi:hypothetical protein